MYEKQASIDNVRVEKDKLLLHLGKNRDAHRALFEEAMKGYRVQSVEILEDHIKRILDNKPERVQVSLPLPEDHTDDYDRVIEMIQWSIDDEIWLDSREFNQYCAGSVGLEGSVPGHCHDLHTGRLIAPSL